MSPKASIGSVAIGNLRMAHSRVVDAEVAVRAWRTLVPIIGTSHPEYEAAETEARDANEAWERLLRSL